MVVRRELLALNGGSSHLRSGWDSACDRSSRYQTLRVVAGEPRITVVPSGSCSSRYATGSTPGFGTDSASHTTRPVAAKRSTCSLPTAVISTGRPAPVLTATETDHRPSIVPSAPNSPAEAVIATARHPTARSPRPAPERRRRRSASSPATDRRVAGGTSRHAPCNDDMYTKTARSGPRPRARSQNGDGHSGELPRRSPREPRTHLTPSRRTSCERSVMALQPDHSFGAGSPIRRRLPAGSAR